MSPQPKPDSDGSRQSLPFEPRKNRKKPEKVAPEKAAPVKAEASEAVKAVKGSRPARPEGMAIPDVVSRRMAKRMALLCGVPSLLGISTFFVSYFLVSKDIVALPTAAVVLLSMGFFGLGVLGLSYGVISASWDEEHPGSLLGWSEFTLNLGRLTQAWRSTDKKS